MFAAKRKNERHINDILSPGIHTSTLYTIEDINDQTISVSNPAGEKSSIPREKFLYGKWTNEYTYQENPFVSIGTDLKTRPLEPDEIINTSEGKKGKTAPYPDFHKEDFPWLNADVADTEISSESKKHAQTRDFSQQEKHISQAMAKENPIKKAAQTKPAPAIQQEIEQ